MRIYPAYGMLFAVILAACQGNGPKEDVIDINEILPKSERYKEGDTLKDQESSTTNSDFDLNLAKETGLNFEKADSAPDSHFLDRFVPKKITRLDLTGENAPVFFGQWTFSDSLKKKNAFFNWLDCFGPGCKSVKYMFSENYQKDPLLIFVNDTSITYITSTDLPDAMKWESYLEKRYGIADWNFIVIQKRKQKANWYYFKRDPRTEKGEFVPFYE